MDLFIIYGLSLKFQIWMPGNWMFIVVHVFVWFIMYVIICCVSCVSFDCCYLCFTALEWQGHASGGTERATIGEHAASAAAELGGEIRNVSRNRARKFLQNSATFLENRKIMQSSEGKFAMSLEIEPVHRSFCRRGSCTFTEVARSAVYTYIYIYIYIYI